MWSAEFESEIRNKVANNFVTKILKQTKGMALWILQVIYC